jgi:hypothetical protein
LLAITFTIVVTFGVAASLLVIPPIISSIGVPK